MIPRRCVASSSTCLPKVCTSSSRGRSCCARRRLGALGCWCAPAATTRRNCWHRWCRSRACLTPPTASRCCVPLHAAPSKVGSWWNDDDTSVHHPIVCAGRQAGRATGATVVTHGGGVRTQDLTGSLLRSWCRHASGPVNAGPVRPGWGLAHLRVLPSPSGSSTHRSGWGVSGRSFVRPAGSSRSLRGLHRWCDSVRRRQPGAHTAATEEVDLVDQAAAAQAEGPTFMPLLRRSSAGAGDVRVSGYRTLSVA